MDLDTNGITKVNSTLGLSPMEAQSLSYRTQEDAKSKKRNRFIETIEFKRNGGALLQKRQKLNFSAKAREGITYQSNSEIGASLELTENDMNRSGPTVGDATELVIVDVETTGLRSTDEIVQIAAQYNDKSYNAYIIPPCDFSAEASAITGLTLKDGELLKNSVILQTVSPERAITELIKFLESISCSVMLAAHNGLRFDAPRILALVQRVKLLKEFQSVVVGFTDTLTFLRKHLGKRRTEKKSFAQSALAEDFLGTSFLKESAHDASTDAYVLQQLLYHKDINISLIDLINAGVTVDNILNAKSKKNLS